MHQILPIDFNFSLFTASVTVTQVLTTVGPSLAIVPPRDWLVAAGRDVDVMHRVIFDGFPLEGVGLGTVQGIVCRMHPLLLGGRWVMQTLGVFPPEARCGLLEIVLGLWWLQKVIFDWRFF
jgi:hypothetical protein